MILCENNFIKTQKRRNILGRIADRCIATILFYTYDDVEEYLVRKWEGPRILYPTMSKLKIIQFNEIIKNMTEEVLFNAILKK